MSINGKLLHRLNELRYMKQCGKWAEEKFSEEQKGYAKARDEEIAFLTELVGCRVCDSIGCEGNEHTYGPGCLCNPEALERRRKNEERAYNLEQAILNGSNPDGGI
jgi:hypothetical protein